MSTVTSFAKEILSRLKGDEQGVIAAQNERKANSALLGTIAALNAKVVDQEELVKDAEDALQEAKYPTTKITDNGRYVSNIQQKQETLDCAKENLENTTKSLVYWNGLVAEFTAQVEA